MVLDTAIKNSLFKWKFCEGFLILISLTSALSSSLDCCQVCDCQSNEVWCEQRQLNSVPVGIPLNTKRLYLFNNNISTIPDGAFADLENLEALDLRSNKLTSNAIKPGVLNGLTNLKDLMLSENKLTTLKSGTFSGIDGLVRLYLKDNRLTSIEDEVLKNLTHLVELKLSNNRLINIPSFHNCPNLRRLCLNNNRLRRLKTAVFRDLNLEELTMSNNFIADIPASLFGATSNMRVLDISKNKLSTPPQLIRNMTSLQNLNLSGNAISSIPNDFLVKLHKLKVLDLKDLQLTSLTRGFIPRRVYLNIFDISRNPWTCNCDISWLIDYIKMFEGMFPPSNQIQCNLPPYLKGRELATLTDGDHYCKRNTSATTTTKSIVKPPEHRPTRRPTVDVCDAMACANGATCYINQTTHMPACRCFFGWKGFLCDELIATPPAPTITSTKSKENPKLLILEGSVTTNSVVIMFPIIGKPIVISTTLLTSKGLPGSPTRTENALPTTHTYTVGGLESGKQYNICITSTDFLQTSNRRTHTIEDKLCNIVTTKAAIITADEVEERDNEDVVGNQHEDRNSYDNFNEETTQKISENEQNYAVVNTSSVSADQYSILIAVGFGLVVVLLVIGLVIYLRQKRSKHSNDNHTTEIPRQHSIHQRRDNLFNSTKKYEREVVNSENTMPLMLRPNSDCNGLSRQNAVAAPYINTPQKMISQNLTESLGRSSNSGGSVCSQGAHCYSDRCCSQSSSGHFSGTIDDQIRNTTPPNATVYNAAMTTPPDNRDHETVYMRHNSPGLSANTYAESSFQEGPMGVVPVLSTKPAANHFHYWPAGADAIHQQTANPGQLSNVGIPMNGYRPLVRPQPTSIHCTRSKPYRFADTSTSQYADDINFTNHLIDNRPYAKTLAV